MLLVDMSASQGSGARRPAELMAEISCTLAFSAAKNNDRVGLVCFTDKVEKYVAPRRKKHVLRVVSDILSFAPSGKRTSITEALKFRGTCTRKAVVFVLSDFNDTVGPRWRSCRGATTSR